jgi:uncharacterized membrane protein YeiH
METTLIDAENLFRLVHFFDIGAAVVFAVSGSLVASRKNMDVAIAMGAVTGTVGGMIRDTLGHVPSVLLSHEIYITASVAGACTYVGCNALGLPRQAAMLVGFAMVFTVRGLAIKRGWSMPAFRESTKQERWKRDPRDSSF